jgi:16S rRNA (guanine527-N7)-methyltransferase
VEALIRKYFPGITSGQAESFSKLQALYEYWNERINVISRKDISELAVRHVLHSLAIAKAVQFKPGTKVLDVGTGGGFPGIPLAILFPDTQFLLADSIGKKIKVVNEVAESLGLKNVRAIQARAEDVDEKFHFVVSRAVTAFPELYKWVKGKFLSDQLNDLPNGLLALKGGDLESEMGTLYKRAKVIDLKTYYEEGFFESKKLVYLAV